MKVIMRRNCTYNYVIRRLSAWLIMTVFIAFGAGCDEVNTDKDNEQPFHTSGVASSSMNKAVNNDPILPAVQQQPVQEPPAPSAFPVYTDKEFAALLEIPFDKVHRVELQADEQLDAVTELISDTAVMYSIYDNAAGITKLFQYDFQVDSTRKVLSIEGSISSLHYSSDRKLLEITYRQGEAKKFVTWSPSSGKTDENPRIILAANEQWTLFRTNKGPGIWASASNSTKEIQLTPYDLDGSPLWLPGKNQFVYTAHTGKKIADGSGYGFTLSLYDMNTRTSKGLAFDTDHRSIYGWLEPGKKLLVEHAFNEGESYNYTEPYEVDLVQKKEYRVLPERMRAYNLQFDPNSSSFVVTIPGYLASYDHSGVIHSLEPLYTDASDRLGGPFKYSPDGTRLAYLMNFETTEDVPISGGRLVISDSLGRNSEYLNAEYLPIVDYDWSPGGDAMAAVVQDAHGSFLVRKRL